MGIKSLKKDDEKFLLTREKSQRIVLPRSQRKRKRAKGFSREIEEKATVGATRFSPPIAN